MTDIKTELTMGGLYKSIVKHGQTYQLPCGKVVVGLGADQIAALSKSVLEAAPASSAMAMQAVAHVANKFGDPEAFAERELRFDDVVIQRLPIGTQLFVLQSQQSPVQASDAGRQG